jgi:PAS domain S-box-containing protein
VFRRLVERANDAIVVIQDGRRVYRNPAYAKLFGYTPDTDPPDLFGAIAPEDRERVRTYYQQRLRGEAAPEQYELTVLAADGRRVCIEVKPSVIEYEGRPATLVVTRDITARTQAETALRQANEELERRVEARTVALQAMHAQLRRELAEREQAEAALRATETRYRTMIEQVNDAVLVLQDGKTVYRNPAREKMLERTPEDPQAATSQSFLDFVAPEDRERVREYYQKRLRGEPVPDAYELTLVSLKGRRVMVEVRPRVIEYEGRPATLVVHRDITARKQAEERLAQTNAELQREIAEHQRTEVALRQAKEAAEVAAQAKSTFLATMSHEIRTPMNGILGMTALLLGTELTPRQHHFADTVRRSGEALMAIINDILDFSKIEAGKLELDHIDFDLHETVGEIVELLAARAQNKGLELMCLFQDEVPSAVRGDPTRLRQILTNLIGNAIKFTAQGEVVVRVATLEQDAETALLRFEVCDTGIGIASEDQSRLFTAFSQVDSSTTRQYGGTGLGLSITKELVHMMGGTIGVESARSAGSTFWFTAHLATCSPDAPAVSGAYRTLSGLRVLIVDANETNRALLSRQVSAWGMPHKSASQGQHALEMLRGAATRRTSYDFVILDRQLPDMDGLELARAMKADPMLAAVSLVMLTSVGLWGDEDKVRQAGIVGYLCKPVRQSTLYNCLVSVIHPPSGVSTAASSSYPGLGTDPALEHRHILLAEDNPVNQEVACEILTSLGCCVQVVASGRAACEALEHATYDLVLMDCEMPAMDGFAATRAIREREVARGQAPLPIIAMTAHAMRDDRAHCLTAGMSDYLSKPFTQEQLHAMLRHWLPQPPRPQAIVALTDSPALVL